MAHEVETMAYANAVPWHGLGARVDESVSVEEMLEAAGLNWHLDRVPLIVGSEWADGSDVPEEYQGMKVPQRFAHIRNTDKKVMVVAGPSWRPLQPAETLGFMHDYVQAAAATLETAGSLRDGKVVWGLASLNHEFEVRRGDKVKGYLLITSPNETGRAITVRTTTVRVVCANTMAMANMSGNGETHYSQAHTSEFDVHAAKEAVGRAHEQLRLAEANARTLDKLKLSISDAMTKVITPVMYPETIEDPELLDEVAGSKDLMQIEHSMENGPGQSEGAGTAWAALNGFTHWADHVAGRNAASRLNRAWMGDNARRKLSVEKGLLELAS